MKLRLTRRAQADLEDLYAWIAADNPFAAERVVERILAALERLRQFPRLGHPGRVAGTLELVIKGTPYIGIYRPDPGQVVILRIRHASRLWPPLRQSP